ncbi:MAG: HEPN domain-containing protein [Emergencia sp.]|nr:HEPN domain-containing protein [Emergencia sp.]
MYSEEQKDLCLYRLSKAERYLADARRTLEMGMYDTAANRSYYVIFHAARAVLARWVGFPQTFRSDFQFSNEIYKDGCI